MPANDHLVRAYRHRALLLRWYRDDPHALALAHRHYANHPVDFITHWMDTYDPRRAAHGASVQMPFLLYPRQAEMVDFIVACIRAGANGLIEKSRDVGATWTCCALSVWLWLYWPGVSIGWGSRKAMLVDRLSDPSSIFEKMRLIIDHLPPEFRPRGLARDKHLNHLRLVNPSNGSSIVGEAGDQIGRGGRTLVYFKDESAHYLHPESIEAALSNNTDCQMDVSSVSGIGTVFQRKREGGVEYDAGGTLTKGAANVFVFDWRHHPNKTQAWYDERRARYERDGLLHIHAQEVDRDYSAALPKTLIKREWVQAAMGLELPDDGPYMGGLDVADGGGDLNALAVRKANILVHLDSWAHGDAGESTRRVVDQAKAYLPMELMYDSVGVGSGVKAESNRLALMDQMPGDLRFTPWNAGAGVNHPNDRVVPYDDDSPLNKDFYDNLRAQAWWSLRNRLEKTWRHVAKGEAFPTDEMISISRDIPSGTLYRLEKELCQVQKKVSLHTMRQSIDKAPEGARSPNLADAMVMAFYPVIGTGAYTRYMLENVN